MGAQQAKITEQFRQVLRAADRLTDKVTSYRLVLIFLLVLTGWTVLLSIFSYGPFAWHQILLFASWITLICRLTNQWLARWRNVPTNKESDLITALILVLILSPPSEPKGWIFTAAAAAAAMASKYLIAINRKHIFNPAAFGAVAAGLAFGYWPSWWVGMEATTPLLLAGGFIIARKMKRLDMVGLFLAVYVVVTFFQLMLDAPFGTTLSSLWTVLSASSLLFFAGVMLTEPYSSPRYRRLYLPYAVLVALLYGLSGLEIRPEIALLIGNLAAFVADPNPRRKFRYIGQRNEAEGIMTFLFEGKKGLKFAAGQYMEWTLPQHDTDSRGNRRYLTIASSPTESEVALSVKLPEQMSSFKSALLKLKPGDSLLGGQLSGSFTLPASEKVKLAWLAGGIGVTPFRSMAKYMTDYEQHRDIVMVYFATSAKEFAFKDVFKDAEEFGLKTHYSVTSGDIPDSWKGLSGNLEKRMLTSIMPDYSERLFYVSGPYGFVAGTEEKLLAAGIEPSNIITDYFPGYS